MQLSATASVYPDFVVTQCPTVEVDQWGAATVSYESVTFIYGSVTLPTPQAVPGTHNPQAIRWIGEASRGWDGHGGPR